VVALQTVKITLFVRVNHGDRINQVSKWGQKFINLKENPIKLYDLLGSR
jgi:ribosome biogenesis protein Tsr3